MFGISFKDYLTSINRCMFGVHHARKGYPGSLSSLVQRHPGSVGRRLDIRQLRRPLALHSVAQHDPDQAAYFTIGPQTKIRYADIAAYFTTGQ